MIRPIFQPKMAIWKRSDMIRDVTRLKLRMKNRTVTTLDMIFLKIVNERILPRDPFQLFVH